MKSGKPIIESLKEITKKEIIAIADKILIKKKSFL